MLIIHAMQLMHKYENNTQLMHKYENNTRYKTVLDEVIHYLNIVFPEVANLSNCHYVSMNYLKKCHDFLDISFLSSYLIKSNMSSMYTYEFKSLLLYTPSRLAFYTIVIQFTLISASNNQQMQIVL